MMSLLSKAFVGAAIGAGMLALTMANASAAIAAALCAGTRTRPTTIRRTRASLFTPTIGAGVAANTLFGANTSVAATGAAIAGRNGK